MAQVLLSEHQRTLIPYFKDFHLNDKEESYDGPQKKSDLVAVQEWDQMTIEQ